MRNLQSYTVSAGGKTRAADSEYPTAVFDREETMPILDTQTRAKLLEETAWANDFSWPEIQTLAQYLSFERVEKDRAIVREGASEAYLSILVKGSARVVKHDFSSQWESALATIKAGAVLGEMSLFDGEPRSATVLALEDTEMLTLSRQNLDRMIKEKPALASKLLLKLGKILSGRLRLASGKLCEMREPETNPSK